MIKLKNILPENNTNTTNYTNNINSIISTIDSTLEKILALQESLNADSTQYEMLDQLYWSIVNAVSNFEKQNKKN